jgi:hypothetical protein
MDEQAILEKLDRIEKELTNHLLTEIQQDRTFMTGMFQ